MRVFAVLCVLLLAACARPAPVEVVEPEPVPLPETRVVEEIIEPSPTVAEPKPPVPNVLRTSDGIDIAFDYYEVPYATKGVIFVHMLNSNKAAYMELATRAKEAGMAGIAIDLRGHGGSTEFSHEDMSGAVEDIRAAANYLKKKGIRRIGIVGASVGANLAAAYAVADPNVDVLVLLSPGLDYRNVKPMSALEEFDRPLLIISSSEDTYSTDSSKQLHRAAKGVKELKVYNDAGHGTTMLEKKWDSMDLVVRWLGRWLRVSGAP